ncbi:F390 synthetase-related protein [Methylobacterium sp. 1030]|uniref:F390 synthetase-related protein n=1 Tax=Methylobacterium sp. 1030 TaxID=3156404 RepID=UPI0033976F0C
MSADALRALWSLLRARATLRRLRTRADVERLQVRRLHRQLARMARTIPFYAPYAGRPFEEWPVVDKASALAAFGQMNAHGVTTEAAWTAAEAGLREGNGSGRIGCLTVGTSTGTSGNRGLFLVSPAERARWLGAILAKALPDFPRRPHRVLVMLATANELYDTAARGRRLAFRFLDVRGGVVPHRAEIERFAPDVVVAPPKALRAMAEEGFAIAPALTFSGGEVMDPSDAAAVAARYGRMPGQIYQATEGFLGVSCSHGTLHLNEDAMLFEFEDVAPGHVTPIITDLLRTSQAMVRYRLNDVLVLGGPCPCGSPLRTVARVEGRADDVLSLPSASGKGPRVAVMPEAVRCAVMDADRSLADFRAVQTGSSTVLVRVPDGTPPDTASRVRASLEAALASLGARAEVEMATGIETRFDRKLRRVARAWQPA